MLNSLIFITINIFLILISIFYIWAKYKLNYWERRGVVTIKPNLLFGNFKDAIFLKSPAGYHLGNLYNEVKSNPAVLGIYIMQKPFLILRDPKIIKQILVKDFNIFSNRYFSFKNENDHIGSDNLFSIDNPQWKYLRQKLSPAFSSVKIKQLFHLMNETSDFLTNYIDHQFKNQNNSKINIEVRDMATKYTTNVVSTLAFGVVTNSFDNPTPEFYVRSRPSINLISAFQILCVFFFPSISKLFKQPAFFGKNTDYFRNVFWSSMNAREQSANERGDLMDLLLKLKNEKQESIFKFDGDSLVAQSAIFFIAGLESSSVTMAFALFEMAKAPEIQKKVRDEIRENIKNKTFNYESVQNLKYLLQVINETLRFYPPAPIIDRVANEDYQIPGTDIVIEKGIGVYIPLPGIHMDPKYFPNPEKFDPERFSDDRKSEITPFTYMPFGEGPRICIAMRVGLLQTAVGLAKILHDYQVDVNPNHNVKISTFNVFTAPANGIHLYFNRIPIEN